MQKLDFLNIYLKRYLSAINLHDQRPPPTSTVTEASAIHVTVNRNFDFSTDFPSVHLER